jgi:hypothetical protein
VRDEVEPHGVAARREGPALVGAGPVDHRHEVVADGPQPRGAEVAQGPGVVGDGAVTLRPAVLDVLVDRDGLDDGLGQPGGLDLGTARRDLLG